MAGKRVLHWQSDDERNVILDHVLSLRKAEIQEFFREQGVRSSGNKEEFRGRLEEELESGRVSIGEVIELLDRIQPWGKQHVFLLTGPSTVSQKFKNPQQFLTHLQKSKVAHLLNKRLPIGLPTDLSLSSIEHSPQVLRVTAVQRRDFTLRDPSKDRSEGKLANIIYKAYVHTTTRALVSFEWNLVENHAFLQISQMQSGKYYDEVRAEFADLVAPWLKIGEFPILPLGKAISYFHSTEEAPSADIRSHGIDYLTPAGRVVSGRSASAQDPLVGERLVDDALRPVRKYGMGRKGNFYFLRAGSAKTSSSGENEEIHVIVLANEGRANFTTNNTEEIVRDVLRRIRAAAQ